MLDGVLKSQNTTLSLSFVSNISITLFHTNHDTRLTSTTNQRGENRARGIISSKSSCNLIKEEILLKISLVTVVEMACPNHWLLYLIMKNGALHQT